MAEQLPNRKAICPDCAKLVTAYVPKGYCASTDGPRTYIFRMHNKVAKFTCPGWARRVPDDAFIDRLPNIDGGKVSEGVGHSQTDRAPSPVAVRHATLQPSAGPWGRGGIGTPDRPV